MNTYKNGSTRRIASFAARAILLAIALLATAVFYTPRALAATSGGYTYTISNGKATITDYSGFEEEVIIPDVLGGKPVAAIGNYAFSDCGFLASVIIPEGVAKVGEGAFDMSDCLNHSENASCLTSVILPSTLTDIGTAAFRNCSALEFIEIPQGITAIKEGTFSGCISLASISLPSTLKSIKNDAFYGCTALKSVVVPEGVTVIDAYAFEGCKSLSSAALPRTLEKVGYRAFRGCSSLAELTLHHKVSTFGQYCFRYLPHGSRILVTTKAQYDELNRNTNYLHPNATSVEYHPKSLAKATTVSSISLKTYTGKYFKPQPTVKRNGKRLVLGADYTLSYANNRKAGKASVIITGKGKYVGSKTVYFKIRPAKATGLGSYAYDGYYPRCLSVWWDCNKPQNSGATGYKVVYKYGSKVLRTVFLTPASCEIDVFYEVPRKYIGKRLTAQVYVYKKIDGVRYLSPVSTIKTPKVRA